MHFLGNEKNWSTLIWYFVLNSLTPWYSIFVKPRKIINLKLEEPCPIKTKKCRHACKVMPFSNFIQILKKCEFN